MSFPEPPPFYPAPDPSDRIPDQARWGMPDIALGALVIMIVSTVGLIGGAVALGIPVADAQDSAALLVVAGLAQQAAQFGWPVAVSKWKGYGIRNDFRFCFKLTDLFIGPALGFGVAIAAGLVGLGVGTLLGVADSEDVSNTGFLDQHRDSPWIYAIVFMVVIGAPFSEELFFRGFCMSTIEKRLGPIAGLLGSTFLFVLPHYTSVAWRETLVIFSVIGVVGLSLGFVTQRLNRLGPAILAHVTFNSIGVLASFAGAV